MSWTQQRIVVIPIDMSEFSMKAFEVARELVPSLEQLRIIHVLPVLEPMEPDITFSTIDDRGRIENAKEMLRNFLKQHGYENLSLDVRLGDPGNEISYFAEEIGAGLIVIPSHGRGMLRRMLLGSTTDRVVHLSPCPVLVLKEKKPENG